MQPAKESAARNFQPEKCSSGFRSLPQYCLELPAESFSCQESPERLILLCLQTQRCRSCLDLAFCHTSTCASTSAAAIMRSWHLWSTEISFILIYSLTDVLASRHATAVWASSQPKSMSIVMLLLMWHTGLYYA